MALLLGAGASFELGMPLVRGVTDQLLAYACGPIDDSFEGILGRGRTIPMRHAFLDLVVGHGMHYEQAIGWLERVEEHVQSNNLSKAELRGLYGHLRLWLIDIVSQQIALAQIQKVDARATVVPLYRQIACWATEHRPLWVFTLNHDLCVEQVAAQHGVRTSNGFFDNLASYPNQNVRPDERLFGRMLKYDSVLNGSAFFQPGESGINLVRLHGAIHQFYMNHEGQPWIVQLEPEVPSVAGWTEVAQDIATKGNEDEFSAPGCITLRGVNEESFRFHRTVLSGAHKAHPSDEFLRLPKYAPILKDRKVIHVEDMREEPVADRNDPAPIALETFARQLQSIRRLVAIGYSFCDDHVNEVVATWLSGHASRTLDIVSPFVDPNNLALFQGSIERVHLIMRGAVDYLRMQEGRSEPLTPSEAEAIAELKKEDEDLRKSIDELRRSYDDLR